MTDRRERLREAFERFTGGKVTVKAFAKQCGWNPNTFKSNLNGAANFSYLTAVKYGQRLGVNPDWLYTGEGEMRASTEIARDVQDMPIVPWPAAARIRSTGDLEQFEDHERLTIGRLPKGDYFATKLPNDSMDRVVPMGSLIVVRIDNSFPEAGGYYLFTLDGVTVFCRFEDRPCVRFEPCSWNPENHIQYLDPNQAVDPIGVVTLAVTRLS